MLYTPLSGAAAELVLCVNQGTRSRKLARRHAEQSASRRSLSRAAARIERTAEYRLSLDQVLEHHQRFQLELDARQKESWLALEDALLEHMAMLNHAYHREGAEQNRRLGWRLQSAHAAARVRSQEGKRGEAARDAEMMAALADIIAKLAAK